MDRVFLSNTKIVYTYNVKNRRIPHLNSKALDIQSISQLFLVTLVQD